MLLTQCENHVKSTMHTLICCNISFLEKRMILYFKFEIRSSKKSGYLLLKVPVMTTFHFHVYLKPYIHFEISFTPAHKLTKELLKGILKTGAQPRGNVGVLF